MCFLNPSYLHLNTLLDRPGPGRPRVRVQLAQEQPDDFRTQNFVFGRFRVGSYGRKNGPDRERER